VLYATRRDAQIVVVGDRELPRILEHGLPQGLDYYSEFIDNSRFPSAGYAPSFRDFLQAKYSDRRFDLVVAMGDIPLQFLEQNRGVLFPDTPIVFFTNVLPVRPVRNATGLSAELNLTGTLALAQSLQPDVRHVFVVSGAHAANLLSEQQARTQFTAYDSTLDFTYLSGLPTRELERRLASLPPHSIVYYLVVDRDGAGEHFHPLEYLDRVTAAANSPVYCWVDSAIGHGIVGGSLKVQSRQVEAVGELSLRVLRGEAAENIRIETRDLNVVQVDWRQLRRWGLSEARLPPGTVVSHREPSAWDRYRRYIIGALAIGLAQTALIAGLLVQRSRRRKAEAQVRKSRERLHASYNRIRDLGARLLSAQDTERSRIARDLHDDISQQIALLTLDLELLARTSSDAALADEALTRAHEIARSVHDLSHQLHPTKLRLLGLVSSLASLQRELARPGVIIAITHENVSKVLAPDLTLCLFRVVQEALQNALKHSQARRIGVDLRGTADGLVLTVEDDGVGFDVEAEWGKGLGLISMQERLDAVGASLDVRSGAGGTRLTVRIALSQMPVAEGVAVSQDVPTAERIGQTG
jgi:signal transduction histidine kinase